MEPELASHGSQTVADSSHIFLILKNARLKQIVGWAVTSHVIPHCLSFIIKLAAFLSVNHVVTQLKYKITSAIGPVTCGDSTFARVCANSSSHLRR